jgi:hypothetical protein
VGPVDGVAASTQLDEIVDQQLFDDWVLSMRFRGEQTIRAAWQIVALGHEQWEQTSSITPKHLAKVRNVQIEMAQHLARFEDGPAVLFTARSTRRQLRYIEQMASELICLATNTQSFAHLVRRHGRSGGRAADALRPK